jgi:RimJ/RimL family protein N-acetyltransferase
MEGNGSPISLVVLGRDAPSATGADMFPNIVKDDIFRLETARMWLRWPRASDAAAVHRYCSRWEVAQYTARIPHPYPKGSAERFIYAAREDNASGRALTLMLTPTRGKRQPIGAVSLEARGVDRLTLGYALAPEVWGQGFASEAVEAMVQVAFSLTHVVEINASVRVENPASRRVLEKAGLVYVGSGPQGAPARGALVQCDRLQIDRAGWAARRELTHGLPPNRNAVSELSHEVP